ncbi:MAG: ATP-binding protein, partial [Aggregatilineales bacterium]
PGIPREAQRRLFDRFYRVRSTESSTTGTGLGLAIVKSVAEQHKGRVTVYSELPLFSTLWQNKGTTFNLILPYRDRPDSDVLQ